MKSMVRQQCGLSLIEVLVAIAITAIGLLGLAGMQSRLQAAEMDAYQRTQALILAQDIASRIELNRGAAASYVTGTGSAVGAGMTCPTSTATRKDMDLAEWCNAIQGAAELSGSSRVGTLIGGRGCVEAIGSNEYMITIAWQGMSRIAPPPSSVACGRNQYDDNASCTNDACRRTLTTIVRIGSLL